MMNDKRGKLAATVLCMAAVYILWGGTYLGIKFAVEQIPPFLMAASRFLIAGVLLYVIARISGAGNPTLRECLGTAPIGILLLACGTGGIAWAEQYLPSGLAALPASTIPFWMTLWSWLIWKGKRPNIFVVVGLALGFAGISVMVLYGNNIDQSQQGSTVIGIVICLLTAICWSFGSSWSRFTTRPSSPLMASAVQTLFAGAALAVVSLASGDLKGFSLEALSLRTWAAMGYLIIFGSVIAYNAYIWLLHNANLSMVSTYTYVNPVVAILLGWAVAGEDLPPIMIVSAAMILTAVVIVSAFKDWTPKRKRAEKRAAA